MGKKNPRDNKQNRPRKTNKQTTKLQRSTRRRTVTETKIHKEKNHGEAPGKKRSGNESLRKPDSNKRTLDPGVHTRSKQRKRN